MESTADLPSLNAVERLLAKNKKSPDDGEARRERGPDRTADNTSEKQVRDIENYKLAVQRMARDVAVLQDQIVLLGDENSAMRSQLQQQQHAATLAADVAQLQSATKEDLLFRYGNLRQELLTKTAELTRYKEKLSRLNQQLTARGGPVAGLSLAGAARFPTVDDGTGSSLPEQLQAAVRALERKYSNMRRAYGQQVDVNRSLLHRAEKAARLERACRLQEKVIERLEQLLQQQVVPSAGQTAQAPDAERRPQSVREQQPEQLQPDQQPGQQPEKQQQQQQQQPQRQQTPQQPEQRRNTPNSPLKRDAATSARNPAAENDEPAGGEQDAALRPTSSRGSAAKMLEGIRELKEQVAALTSAVRSSTAPTVAAGEPSASIDAAGAERQQQQQQQQPQDEGEVTTTAGPTGGSDLRLLVELEAAENRIRSLESQVKESARLWGKEKAELLLRLQEAEQGVGQQGDDDQNNAGNEDAGGGRSGSGAGNLGDPAR